MADILLLSSCPTAARRIREAVQREAAGGVHHRVRQARGWAELTVLASSSACAVAFVDPYGGGAFAAAEIRRLRERAPALEIVACADFAGRPAADAFSIALLGVRALVDPADGMGAFVDAVREHLNRAPLDEMVETLASALPPAVHRWLAPVLVAASAPEDVAALARAARCSPRTLRRSLRAAELPTPEQLLAWRRLLHAARLMGDGRTADGVARSLGFSSGSALRKSLKQLTGLRPRDLSGTGGARILAGLFIARCGGAGVAVRLSVAA
ncbi:MAG TPA: helix-turn-helix domain-containing protein [Longimicrobium sp.]